MHLVLLHLAPYCFRGCLLLIRPFLGPFDFRVLGLGLVPLAGVPSRVAEENPQARFGRVLQAEAGEGR